MENDDHQVDLQPKSKNTVSTPTPVAKARQTNDLKLKLNVPDDHPLAKFAQEIKQRGVKNFDMTQLILEVFDSQTDEWWSDKLESETPLEFKINRALSDPNMREKLKELVSDSSTKQGELHS